VKRHRRFSVGGPGASFNIGRKGTRTTLGLPGTGLSYGEQEPRNKPGTPIARSRWRWLFWVVLIGGMVVWAIAPHAQQTTVMFRMARRPCLYRPKRLPFH
jgi:hypothetical protein